MIDRLLPIYFSLLFILVGPLGFGQKFLQVEKIKSLKLIKYHLGDDFVFRSKLGGSDWYQRTITDVDRDLNMIFLDYSVVDLSDITYIKSFKNRGWSSAMAQSMRIFGLSWVMYTAVDDLAFGSGDWEVAGIIAGSSLALSIPLELLFKSKTHNVKSKFRLRIMDIGF